MDHAQVHAIGEFPAPCEHALVGFTGSALQAHDDDAHGQGRIGKTPISRDGFTAFTKPLLLEATAIATLSWVPRVPDSERARFELEGAIEGLANYQIKMMGQGGHMAPSPKRDEYYPVFYCTLPKTSPDTASTFVLNRIRSPKWMVRATMIGWASRGLQRLSPAAEPEVAFCFHCRFSPVRRGERTSRPAAAKSGRLRCGLRGDGRLVAPQALSDQAHDRRILPLNVRNLPIPFSVH